MVFHQQIHMEYMQKGIESNKYVLTTFKSLPTIILRFKFNTGLPNLYAPWWQTRELKVALKKVGKSLFSYKNDEWCMLFIC